MRRIALAVAVCGGFLIWAAPVYAQAAAEAGLGAAASSLGSGAARGVGKSIGGILGGLDKTIKPEGAAASSTTVTPSKSGPPAKSRRTAAKPAPAPEPAPSYEDAGLIEKGLAQDDLLRRFGPPAMQIASSSDAQTLTYVVAGGVVQVELQGGRVISVAKPKSGA